MGRIGRVFVGSLLGAIAPPIASIATTSASASPLVVPHRPTDNSTQRAFFQRSPNWPRRSPGVGMRSPGSTGVGMPKAACHFGRARGRVTFTALSHPAGPVCPGVGAEAGRPGK